MATLIYSVIASLDEKPIDAHDAYLRLHLLSHRLVKPHGQSLDGIFGFLANVVRLNIYTTDVEGTRNVLEAARRNEVRRTVYTSTLAVNSDTEEQVVDETYRFTGEHLSDYDRSKAEAHDIALDLAAQGLDVVIVQPGLVYGPGDTAQTGAFIEQVVRGKRPLAPAGGGVCWAHVDDVAEGHVLAMEKGRSGESYMLAGPRATLADGLRMVAGIAGTKGPIVLPTRLVRMTAALMGVVGKVVPVPPDLAAETARAGLASYYGTPAKAERELGWHARPLEQGLRQTVEHLQR